MHKEGPSAILTSVTTSSSLGHDEGRDTNALIQRGQKRSSQYRRVQDALALEQWRHASSRRAEDLNDHRCSLRLTSERLEDLSARLLVPLKG